MKELLPRYPVLATAKQNTHATSEQYEAMYRQSIEAPETFWAEQAEKFIDWYQPWDSVTSVDYH